MSKTLGILAGLGPLAGAHFYRRLIELTPADDDSEHLSVVLISESRIPSRLAHLEGRGPSPLGALTSTASRLVAAGAEVIVIPSTTTHAYYDNIAAHVSVPVLNLIELVADDIVRHSYRRVAIVATSPTRQYGLYDTAFRKRGVEAIYPDPTSQKEIMAIIQGVKSTGNQPAWGERLLDVMSENWATEADGIVLACTETPVAFQTVSASLAHEIRVIDATDILAKRAIAVCTGDAIS